MDVDMEVDMDVDMDVDVEVGHGHVHSVFTLQPTCFLVWGRVVST